MMQINITPSANQSLSVRLDGSRYEIVLKLAHGVMMATIVRNGVTVVDSTRILAGQLILPYLHIENGNFFISTENDALPDWQQFGNSQFLYYLSPDELTEARNG